MDGWLVRVAHRSSVLTWIARRCRTIVRFIQYMVYVLRLRLTRNHAIAGYFSANPIRKLQIGAGRAPLEGWLNSDIHPRRKNIIFLDASAPLPFPDGCFDYIFSEHMIEHLSRDQGLHMLRECFRVLKPSGKIRISTPNLENILRLYFFAEEETSRQYMQMALAHSPEILRSDPVHVINNFFYNWGHRFLYDAPALRQAMEKAGFRCISSCRPGESSDENLANLESHHQEIGPIMNAYETFVLEAVRPSGSSSAGQTPGSTG